MKRKTGGWNKGFTLIEILAVIAISVFLIAGGFVSLSSYRDSRILDSQTSVIISLFKTARTNTLASKGGLSYGIHIGEDRIILFQGQHFSPTDTENKAQLLANTLEIKQVSLSGGGQDVVFNRLTGTTDNNGSFVLQIKNSTGTRRIIKIEKTGKIDIQKK